MLTLPPSVQIYLCTSPVDMRKQADGLSILVAQVLGQQPLSGHLFVFFNRARDVVRILFWDRNGYCLYSKRLEKGRFRLPTPAQEASSVTLEASELGLLLEGIELAGSQRRPRWNPQLPA